MFTITSTRRTIAGAALALLSLTAAAVPAVAAAKPAPQVPSTLVVEPGHKLFLSGHATGVQIYRCDASGSSFAWALVAPRAIVVDRKGKQLMTHFGGPSWQTKDGSTVVGQRVDGVTVDPTAIPWLLIRAASTTNGPEGGDRLSATTFIQRTHTTGGLPPAPATCTAGDQGDVVEVPYTADYHFWKRA
jgi:hypothetical protein